MNYSSRSSKRRTKKRRVRIEETLFPALFPDEFIAEAQQDLFCNEILLNMLKNPNFECAFRNELSIERIIEIKKSLGEDCSLDYEEALEKTRAERDELLKMFEIKDEEKKRDQFDKACEEHVFLHEFMRLLKESNFSINVQNMNVQGDANVTRKDFTGFKTLIETTYGKPLPFRIDQKELSDMNSLSFSREIDKWDIGFAPVKRTKEFNAYKDLAMLTLDLLDAVN